MKRAGTDGLVAVAALTAMAALGALALSTAACDRLPGRPDPGSAEVRPDRVQSFSLLYAQNCAGCHGVKGDGGGAAAIGLANPIYLAIADDEVLRRVTAHGLPGTLMPAFARTDGGTLTEAQVEILVSGIRAWAPRAALEGETPPPYAGGPGNPERGLAASAVFCASCHGSEGGGGAKAGSIVDGSFLGLVSDQGLRTTIIAGRPEIGHPDWRHAAPGRVMTAQEISDVVAWLSARRPATPGQPYPGRTP